MIHDRVIIRLKSGNADYDLDLGFIPKKAVVTVMSHTSSLPQVTTWFGEMMEDSDESETGSWEYGINRDKDGTLSYNDTAAKGISAYDGAKSPQVLIPNPSTDIDEKVTVDSDFTAGDTQPTARSATAVGTVYRPNTHNGYVYECITSNDVLGTEPTWPTTPGETVTDDTTNVFICREENIVANKGLGITLGATMIGNDKIVYVEAYRALRCEDIGDIG